MKYKLVPGKWCSECCFGENHSGIIVCVKHFKACIPGETVYKEVPSTNGDRIRAMSDEQIAHAYTALTFWLDETGMPYYKGPEEDDCYLDFDEAYNKWLQWLKQEAKEEEE